MHEPVTAALAASSNSVGVAIVLFVGLAVAMAAFWLWALVDVLSWPGSTWDEAGLDKARWVVRIAFLGAIGAMFYVASPRRELRAAYATVRWGS